MGDMTVDWRHEKGAKLVAVPNYWCDYAGGPPDGSLRGVFAYDYLGRRVSQVVESYDTGSGTWTVVAYTKYISAGWLMLMELDGLSSDAVLRRNTWGRDLAGQAGSWGVYCGVDIRR